MSNVFRAVGTVAGVVASVAAFVPGGQGIAAIAGGIAAVSSIAAQLTAKPPATQGQVSQQIFGANVPQPYLMGRSSSAGVKVYDFGYGGKVNGVQNPYRFKVVVYSVCGPVSNIESFNFDHVAETFTGTSIDGYYEDFFWRDFQLGERPESAALTPNFSGAPNWGTDYKLSGMAAIGMTYKWSKRGKRFTGGQVPLDTAIIEGVSVYDPRLDSTVPGSSGTHRINDETTWEYSQNPALHALAYSYGRYTNGVKVFGVDLGDDDAIDVNAAIAWANTCDANGWTVSGTIYEPVAEGKWNNLKRICEAGGGVPIAKAGLLSFDYQAPRTSLATITKDDLADGEISAQMGRQWKSRLNTVIPRYRSEAHQWEYVQSEAVDVPAWITDDGEVKSTERRFDLVDDKDQAAQLAMYYLRQLRETGPFTLTLKSHLRVYAPGDSVTLGEDLGVHPDGDLKVVIRSRSVDPISGTVTMEFEQESDAKHAIALAQAGTAPDTIEYPTAAQIDAGAAANTGDFGPTFDSAVVTMDSTEFTMDQT